MPAMQFRLSTLLWVILVFATSMSLAGGWGIPLALYWVVQLWLCAGKAGKYGTKQALVELVTVTMVLGMLIACLLPLNSSAPQAARRSQCANNLKQIGLALHAYRDQWKCFPPAVVYDASGKPLHSWRTLILPYIDEERTYSACDLKLPWNEGKNASILGRRLPVYSCPSDAAGAKDPNNVNTSYVAIVGPGTVWDPAAKSPPNDTRIMAVEMSQSGIAWAEPKDLSLAEVLGAAEDEDRESAVPRSGHPGGFQVLMANGSVQYVPTPISRRLLEILLTRSSPTEAETREVEKDVTLVWQRRQQRQDEAARKQYWLMALTFVVWVASVAGFGWHAFQVRSADRQPPPAENGPGPDASIPGDSPGP
jgi:type II secretory pathway pseudopilin PulG